LSAPIIAFFNDRAGVGTTTLVYHLAWMFSDLGMRVLSADLDPQADLTAAFLGRYGLEISAEEAVPTIYTALEPMIAQQGDIREAEIWDTNGIKLLVGDLRLSGVEDLFATGWSECQGREQHGFVVTSSFWRILTQAAVKSAANVVLLDLGPNLCAINRAILLAADYLVVPLGADRFSLQGVRTLGPVLQSWKKQWAQFRQMDPEPAFCPAGKICPIGYIVQQHSVHLNWSAESYEWMPRIPRVFRRSLLSAADDEKSVKDDPWCLALLKHYHSLMPMAQEAQKPMFHLKAADGAIGAHFQAAQSVGQEFKRLAERIAERVGLKLPYLS
jgi:cellulose biosynthesis protein BcsQ